MSTSDAVYLADAADFGELVRAARKSAGLRQDEVAFAANTSVSFIVDLEKGKPTVRLGMALAVAAAVGVHISATRPS